MTILPAKRLEIITQAAKRKGRLQVGADADITVFDPAEILDTATFEDDLSFSNGVRHVFVNGAAVVRGGETVEGSLPGRPLLGRFRN
jgi:N-acyl-D-aspartate/D-glutamate deacylase